MIPRALGSAALALGLCLPTCLDYDPGTDACAGVVCDTPPPPTCVDGITLRTHHVPGTCSQGVCAYPFVDDPCAGGTCQDGQCLGCQPACAGSACGPDGCGGACGACQAGCACTAEGQCDCGCQGILVDNQGIPEAYPSLYVEPTEAAGAFQARLAAFKTRRGLADFDYDIRASDITWAPTLRRQTDWAYVSLGEGALDESNTSARAAELFAAEGEFFLTAGLTLLPGRVGCTDSECEAVFAQDYCGLKLGSEHGAFDGEVSLRATREDSALQRASSNAVPLVPVPRNPLLSGQEARERMLGQELRYACPDGPHTVVVSDLSQLTLEPGGPMVWVHPSATLSDTLELHLAYRIGVDPDSASRFHWVCALDALDGTLISATPQFDCD